MKRMYISFIFLIIALILASIETGLVSAKADIYISMIENTDRQMRKDNFEEAIEMCAKLEEGWNENAAHIDTLLIHDYVDNIGNSITKMRVYAENGTVELYFAESALAKKELTSIKESEYPKIENIL